MGVYAASYEGTWWDRFSSIFVFLLYSLPTFWIATLAIIFLTNDAYGMNFFPALGLSSAPRSASSWTKFWNQVYHLILPVSCLALGGVAFIVRQMRSSMKEVLTKDYITSMRALGFSEQKIRWKYALKNALYPLITLVANMLPALIAGSVVIEQIFAIPGMGKLTIDAIFQRDWPVVYAVLMIGAFLTVLGILLTDILYSFFDPRVKLK